MLHDILMHEWYSYQKNHMGQEPNLIIMNHDTWYRLVDELLGYKYLNQPANTYRGKPIYRSDDVGKDKFIVG